MAGRKELSNLLGELVNESKGGFSNLKKCEQLMEKLKLALIRDLSYMPTTTGSASKDDLKLARDILEMGVLYSIAAKDIPGFERYMAQLKSYYMDYKTVLPESDMKFQLIGLNLLFLLSQNRVAEFHTELELLSPQEIQNNVFIHYPVSLEQYLMEGSYNKIFLARDKVPAASYSYFLEILVETIRDENAACMEKSYEKLKAEDAAKMLGFTKPSDLLAYAEKRNWKLDSNNHYNFHIDIKKTDETLSSVDLAKQAIEYARELEMIV